MRILSSGSYVFSHSDHEFVRQMQQAFQACGYDGIKNLACDMNYTDLLCVNDEIWYFCAFRILENSQTIWTHSDILDLAKRICDVSVHTARLGWR
jgi:hypothetical protein